MKNTTVSYGIFAWFGFILPPEEKFALIREAGFTSVCTWWDDALSEVNGKRITHADMAQRAGLILENGHLPYSGTDALWFDSPEGDAMEKALLDGIRDAGLTGVPTLVLHPYEWDIPAGGSKHTVRERFLRLGEAADKAGVRLAIENLSKQGTYLEFLSLLPEDPVFGVCFDIGHGNIAAPGNFEIPEQFANRLYALHLHDNSGTEDGHLLPGQGNIDWSAFGNVLSRTGYAGSYMLESCCPAVRDQITDIRTPAERDAATYLEKAFAAVSAVLPR